MAYAPRSDKDRGFHANQMKTVDHLFQERRNHSWIQALRIMRLISSSSGFPILVGLLLILLYAGYRQLFQLLHPSFPINPILAGCIAWSITFSFFRTWLQKPDLLFLLPMEHKLKPYFQASLRYNRLFHGFRISLILILLYPFLVRSLTNSLMILLFFLLIMGYQMIYTRICWDLLTVEHKWIQWGLFCFHFLCIDALLEQWWILFAFSSVMLLVLLLWIRRSTPFYPWPWTLMIHLEQKRVSFYNSMASWFMELPRKKSVIKQRKVLVNLLRRFERRPSVFSYLYWRRFLRDDEYLYPYLRLFIFSSVLMVFLPNPYLMLFLYIFSLILTAIHLSTLTNRDQYPLWIALYPKPTESGLTQISLTLLGLQSVFLSVIAGFVHSKWWFGGGLFLLGGLFIATYHWFYLPHSQQQKKKPTGFYPP